ncbi:MAG: ATP-binding cassette domain-containing protein [Candidatus Hodarchaeota archaeon]
MVKVYTGALIDKPLRSINRELRKKVSKDLRKSLKIRSGAVTSQELNTFLLASGRNGKSGFNQHLIDKIEKGTIRKRFTEYYNKNETRFRNYMKNNQELYETAQIVKDFIREIDSSLPKKFDQQLKKINSDLPNTFCQVSMKSFIALWDIEEEQEFRFNLSGFDFPIFSGKTTETPIDVGNLVDKLLIVNFFETFLKSTLLRLDAMNHVLEQLEQEIEKQHYRINDEKLQSKLELFLRILVAKLSALQELENLIIRIFNLFDIPYMILTQYHFKSDFSDLNTEIARICEEIKEGKDKLHEVGRRIDRCQLCLRDYLDDGVNGIITANSTQIFKEALKPLAELSIDLFIEAELLKHWSDYFGSDVPYFSFNVQLDDVNAASEAVEIDDDVILAVRGLYKNYNLGRTTVYAVRGVNLDIKAGEFVAIVGSSGAGKTTLLNCMASLDSPDHGAVYFYGKNLHKMKDSEKAELRLRQMGFIFQSYALLPHFDTRENVTLPANLAGGLSKDIKTRIENLLVGVGITEQAKQYPAQLSGGQMQRVAIARALTNQPAIIFADEPTGDLDSVTGVQVMELLKKFHEETNTTIIIITHEESIATYADRQILMEDGVITQRKQPIDATGRPILMEKATLPERGEELSPVVEERVATIEKQLESITFRLSELTQILESRSVETRTGVTKEFNLQLDEIRAKLEVLELETNNKILDLSDKFNKLNINSSNWSFSVNEQMESFRSQYVNVLEKLRKSITIAVTNEKVISQKYSELVEQLKEKEQLAIEKENLNQIRISSLKDEIERKEKDLEIYISRLNELEAEIKDKSQRFDESAKIKMKTEALINNYRKLKEAYDIKSNQVKKLQSQLITMTEDATKIIGRTKAIKAFLDESESGRILNQLLTLDQVTLDELATKSGIATYSVLQVIQHLRDLGVVQYDETTRQVKLVDK